MIVAVLPVMTVLIGDGMDTVVKQGYSTTVVT